MDIDRSAAERLEAYSGRPIILKRCALTEEDILSLPANPTKSSDARSPCYVSKYGDKCWELDALPPDVLKERVKKAIEAYIDFRQWGTDLQQEIDKQADIKLTIEKMLVQ